MNHLEDDMDELFNKAGHLYPLKTESADWDSVKAALDSDGAGVVAKPKTSYRRFLPLLLLLLIPAVYVFIDKDNVRVADASEKNMYAGAPKATKENAAETNIQHETGSKKSTPVSNTTDNNLTSKNNSSLINPTIASTTTIKPNSTIDKSTADKSSTDKSSTDKSSIDKSLNLVSNKQSTKIYSHQPSTADQPLSRDHSLNLISHENESSAAKAWTSFPSLLKGYTLNNPSAVIDMDEQSTSFVPNNASSSVPNPVKKKKNNIKGLYYGITATPDLSTIKGQSIKGVGYSAGILLGYNINAHFAVESGILWSRKKYYTDGKYFNKSKPQIPDYIDIHWLNGGCNMFEFPLIARYNLKAKRNTFFVSTGVTSYLMKKEDYTYSATAGAGGYPYEGKRSYNRSGDHLFANLQLSAGYNFSFSPKMNFRIEPYLKAPLKKIGIGQMPITSTGLYLSLTRDFR